MTSAWERFLADVYPRRWYRKIRNTLATKYLTACYPLDRFDLWSEIDIAVASALPKFQAVLSWKAFRLGCDRVKLSTYVFKVAENRLIDLRRIAGRQIKTVPLAMDGDDARANEPVWEFDVPAWMDWKRHMATPGGADLLRMVLGEPHDTTPAGRQRRKRFIDRVTAES